MDTPSLFEQKTPATAPQQPVDETPRILSVGVFPKEPQVFADSQATVSWFQKLKNLFSRKKETPVVKAVQTEWALDRVTVVRNDLSDTDFDIVMTEPADKAEARRQKAKRIVGRAWKKVEVAVANPEPVDTLK